MAKVSFLQNIWYEYLGVMSLSATLKANNHEVEVVIGNKNEILNSVIESRPDLIAFSAMTIQHNWVSEMADYIKKAGIKTPIIVGGPHVTFFPEMIDDPSIDIICIGEGEYPLLDLVNALDKGEDISRIENLWVKQDGKVVKNKLRPLVKDLDELEYPDRNLYGEHDYFKNTSNTIFMASRGCPYNCSFCFNKSWSNLYDKTGRKVRLRSVDNVIDEINRVKDTHGIDLIMFTDSTFNINKKWLLKFLEVYTDKVKLPFSCNVRANLVDEDVVMALAKTECCSSVRFAIETGNEELRNGLLEKKIYNKDILTAASLFKKCNIPLVTFNMFGLPGETLKNALETIRLNQRVSPSVVSNYMFMPFPGLKVTDYAIENNLMAKEDVNKLGSSPYRMHKSILNQKDISKVSNLHKFSIIAVKFPFLMPAIKLLIRFPENRVFYMVYNVSQVVDWMKWSKAGPIRILSEIIHNYREVS
jgi:radical SAM superfamily enzyme YgiQ (UPF0313 family)